MKATILVNKQNPKQHGLVISGTLYKTGSGLVPQLFPEKMTKNWLQSIVRFYNTPFTNSLDEFRLVNVDVIINDIKEE